MCGLTGFWHPRVTDAAELAAAVEKMSLTICHRGPDDSGVFTEPAAGVALGFRRLSIIDLSELGHQPMRSASGRYSIVFNGEVYNFADLRRELEAAGASFRGHSDTEVILASFEQWGIADAVRRFVGMFAMAVWDARERSLSLVRDRLGIKPMYYYHEPGYLAFGSELKTISAGPCFIRELDREALGLYFRYLYVPAPRTIWRGARKLLPGHILTVKDPQAPPPESRAYWSVRDVAHAGASHQFAGSAADATAELERLLKHAVSLRMIADVPLGALLSGGVDSSTVVAMMQASSSRPVKTYTIAFDDPAHDEAAFAGRVARHLGTEHTEMMVTGREALDVVPRLADMFDEPHADPSLIPSYLVCALARKEVIVALTGDGGDELFAGYNRYTQGERLMNRMQLLPEGARRLVGAGIDRITKDRLAQLHRSVEWALPAGLRPRLAGEKLRKMGPLLRAGSVPEMYRSLMSAWHGPALVLGAGDAPDLVLSVMAETELPLLERMQLADQLGYLPDDLLSKVDRASMAVSLEARVPLLDHRVVEFSWTLPRSLKIQGTTGKWLLREVLHRYVPAELVERPKVGFSTPVDGWLKGPLNAWARDLLARERVIRAGVLDPDVVAGAWRDFEGGYGPGISIWALLMFQAWHERWAA